MSKDIRSFFSVQNAKKPSIGTSSSKPSAIKRKAIQLSSDEDEVPGTPKEKKPKRKVNSVSQKNKSNVIESDESDVEIIINKTIEKKPNLIKLKPQTPTISKQKPEELLSKFGEIPKRVEKKKYPKQKTEDEKLLDDDFDETIIDFDEEVLVKESTKYKQIEISPKKDTPETKVNSNKSQPNNENIASTSNDIHKFENKKIKVNTSIVSEKTPNGKSIKKVDLNSSSALSDEERHERKRAAAMLYQKYKNRQSALNPGSKEIPKGKPNCLVGLSFVVSGVLESMERDEACSVIKELGGKISSTVGKRLNYVVAGEEAGPKKLATADELGIKIITEDELFDLIREKSGESKNTVKNKSVATNFNDSSSHKKTPIANTIDTKTVEIVEISKKDNSKERKKSGNTPEKRKTDDDTLKSTVKKEKIEHKKNYAKNNEKFENLNADESLQWVDKYKPTSLKQIIGQQGASSNCVKLTNWLSKWYINQNGKNKLSKPNPWAKNDDGSYYKAALLSGPPGVGKSTTATLVCKELDFDVVEFNASDTRSKKLLKEEVSELLSNKSLYGYFHGNSDIVSTKHVLIMDEVDGMAGNEDRGGMQELIALIKDSNVPIICMCNDRNHQKMRSLVNYCYDLRFNRPKLEQIKGLIMSICFKENIKLPSSKIEEIILATNQDIRQTIHHLSLLSVGKGLNILDKNDEKTAQKDMKLGPWDVVRKVFSIEEHKNMSFYDKYDLFFHDYSLGPLFVQQNYLQVLPSVPTNKIPEQVALAADSLSLGDLIDKRIRSNSAWSLLPIQSVFSSVMPGEYMEGRIIGQINFPGWLGKYSKSNKRSRLAQEIHDHTRIRTSGSRLSIRLDYAPFLLNAICRPLTSLGLDGIEQSLAVIKEYNLLREDIDSLIELVSWPGKKNPMDLVDGRIKAALTRTYNKEVLAYTYSAQAGIKKKRSATVDDFEDVEGNEENAISDDEENDDKIENDGLIKSKVKTGSKATKKKPAKEAKAGTSRGVASTSKKPKSKK